MNTHVSMTPQRAQVLAQVGSSAVKALNYNKQRQYATATAAAAQETLILPLPKMSFVALLLVVLLSALSVVYIKDYNRCLFVEYQNLQKNYTTLQANEGKLLLEQGLVASRTLVQEIAERDLNMQMPMAKNVVIVKA